MFGGTQDSHNKSQPHTATQMEDPETQTQKNKKKKEERINPKIS
jgi:hypothetical protein